MPDNMTLSRLELRLETEIRAAPSVLEADCKRAELAAYRVRLGRVEEVELTLHELHQRYRANPNVAISAWINLVEGLVGHFGDMDPGARDKVLRAHALSSAAGLRPMRALTAAWLAHFDYLEARVESMALHISLALDLSTKTHYGAKSRVSLVVAQAYHVSGRIDTALLWYMKARDHALSNGDDATISAIMHNMAWLRAHELRKSFFSEQKVNASTRQALLGAESTGNFDSLIGAVSLSSLIPLLRAQILSVSGRELDALEIYEVHLFPHLKKGMQRLQADLIADMAWCRLSIGQTSRARQDAATAALMIDSAGHFDDQALAHSRLAQIFYVLGDSEKSAFHRRFASDAWAGHALLQKRISEALDKVFSIRNHISNP